VKTERMEIEITVVIVVRILVKKFKINWFELQLLLLGMLCAVGQTIWYDVIV